MLDTITLPRNLIEGFGVPSAPEPMIKYRFHLILESTFQFNWRRWGLYPAVFPVRLKKRYVKLRMDSPARIHFNSYATGPTTCTTSNGPIHLGRSLRDVSLCFRLRYFVLNSTLSPTL